MFRSIPYTVHQKQRKGSADLMKLISIIVPCLNEQEVIPIFYRTVTEVLDSLENAEYELLFVDDGSDDRTLKVLKELKKKDRRCRYLSFTRNFGKEAAIYAGLIYAKGDYVGLMDVDLQDPPKFLGEMYRTLETGEYDCVAARTRKMRDAVLKMGEYNRFSKGLFSWVGFRTKWLSYHNVERAAGETKWSFGKLLRYSLDGIMGFSTLPLSLSSYGGIFFCGAAFLAILFLVVRYLIWHDPVQGWTTLMCAMLLISGVQLLCVGILGQYLARIYLEVKNRPVYLLKETDEEETENEA